MSGLFTEPTYVALCKALDAFSLRHQVIANNIANVSTPGYKAQEVFFQEELRDALKRAEAGTASSSNEACEEIKNVKPLVGYDERIYRLDSNSVDIDVEMAKLADNTLSYNTVAQLVSAKLRLLASVINEGRR